MIGGHDFAASDVLEGCAGVDYKRFLVKGHVVPFFRVTILNLEPSHLVLVEDGEKSAVDVSFAAQIHSVLN